MAVMQHKRETLSEGDGIVQKDTQVVTEDDVVEERQGISMFARVVYLITSIIIGLLLIRFTLSLLGANRANAFADLMYSLSQPFVAPFFGLFNYQTQYGVVRFEFETLVAVLIYALLGGLVVRIAELGGRGHHARV